MDNERRVAIRDAMKEVESAARSVTSKPAALVRADLIEVALERAQKAIDAAKSLMYFR